MARIFPRNINQLPQPSGKLIIEEYHPGFNQVYFVPPPEKLEEAGLDQGRPEQYKKLILEINSPHDSISIYPLNTLGTHKRFLKPKYEKIKSITLNGFDFGNAETADEVMEVLEALPSSFVKDYDYDLGLRQDYRFLNCCA